MVEPLEFLTKQYSALFQCCRCLFTQPIMNDYSVRSGKIDCVITSNM